MKPLYHILLADDDDCIRKLYVEALIYSGYRVDIAKDGVDAWTSLNNFSYDLLITDHDMPWLKGLDLIKKLRSENLTLPVILASGTMPVDEFKECPDLHIDGFLLKPFAVTVLLDAVKKVLSLADSGGLPVASDMPGILQTQNENDHLPDSQNEQSSVDKSSESISVSEFGRTQIKNKINIPRRVLVVNDESAARQLTIDVLIDSGYEVEGVKDGAAGWEALQTKAYDLVITDNKMPRMTGIEMIENLRYARMTIPVIMATGSLPVFEIARKPWLKPDGALQQPYSNDDLLTVVKRILGEDSRPRRPQADKSGKSFMISGKPNNPL